MEIIDIYTDGSVHVHPKLGNIASWGFVALRDNKELYSNSGVLTGDITSMRQIGGELKAVIEGIKYCKNNNYKAKIYHDYNGIYYWVADFFKQKAWQAKNKFTKKYRESISNNLQYIEEFIWIKGHSGVEFNEKADDLARLAYKKFLNENDR